MEHDDQRGPVATVWAAAADYAPNADDGELWMMLGDPDRAWVQPLREALGITPETTYEHPDWPRYASLCDLVDRAMQHAFDAGRVEQATHTDPWAVIQERGLSDTLEGVGGLDLDAMVDACHAGHDRPIGLCNDAGCYTATSLRVHLTGLDV